MINWQIDVLYNALMVFFWCITLIVKIDCLFCMDLGKFGQQTYPWYSDAALKFHLWAMKKNFDLPWLTLIHRRLGVFSGSGYWGRQPEAYVLPPTFPHDTSILFLNSFTVLLVTAFSGNLFHSFITRWEKLYFRVFSLTWPLNSIIEWPLVLWLVVLRLKSSSAVILSICFKILNTSMRSALVLRLSKDNRPVLFNLSS